MGKNGLIRFDHSRTLYFFQLGNTGLTNYYLVPPVALSTLKLYLTRVTRSNEDLTVHSMSLVDSHMNVDLALVSHSIDSEQRLMRTCAPERVRRKALSWHRGST